MKFKLLFSIITLTLIQFIPNQSYAVSDDECGIWLCAPMGFRDSACNGPHRAMHRRVHRGQAPVPPISACGGNTRSENDVIAYDGRAAFIPEHQECAQYRCKNYLYGNPKSNVCLNQECAEYKTVSASWVKDRWCNPGCGHTGCSPDPKGCTRTGYYVEIKEASGMPIGETYYFNLDF